MLIERNKNKVRSEHKNILFFVFLLFFSTQLTAQTLTGFVRENGSQEQLAGVSVFCVETKKGAISNKYGFYSLVISVAKDSVTLVFSLVGYETKSQRLLPQNTTTLDVTLAPVATQLQEVVVKAQEPSVSRTVRMSVQNIPIQQVREIPALLGEKDIMKILQLLPGIQRGNDGNGLIFVRGGAADQNLLLLDEAPVYNMFHAGGFFSVFNGNALKNFEVMKGAFPARYGGRLSSVIEVQTKDGNKERLAGDLTVGLLSSSAVLEGPLKKGKASFLLSGRVSYWDKIYDLVRPKTNDRILFGLYDYTAKIHWEISPKDKLYVSTYAGRDSFVWKQGQNGRLSDDRKTLQSAFDFGLNWGNQTATVRWNRVFSKKLFANTSLIFSNYDFRYFNSTTNVTLSTQAKITDESSYQARIQDLGLKTDFDYFINDKHQLRFGGGYTRHRFVPERIQLFNSASAFRKDTTVTVLAREYHLYIEEEFKPTARFTLNAGLRFTGFGVETKNYLNLEPRLNFAYLFPNDLALKGGYARMNQFAHLASNSGVGFPFDVWIPSTARIAPQQADQFSLGLAKDVFSRNVEISVEGFYKQMRNLIGLREGAAFFSGNTLDIFRASLASKQETWDNKIVQGAGLSYGLEVLIQKKKGKFSGWLSYTWSKVTNQFAELNNGRSFFPRYDRRHSLSLVGIYHLTPRTTFSGTWTYASGQRLTLPVSNFGAFDHSIWNTVGSSRTNAVYEYSNYGNFKTPDYHRLDLNVQFHKNKTKKRARTWEIGVFNAYNRLNPFFFTFSETNPSEFQKVSLFPIIGSVSYNYKF